VLELDPENAKIRSRLGYRKFQGEWLTEQEINERQGLVKYRGRARTKQEIELIEERTLVDQKQKTWYQQIKRIREDLDSRDEQKSTLAKEKLLSINDPYAVKALAYYYKDESDRRNDPVRSRHIKLWIVEVLGHIRTAEALTALVEYSLMETDDDIRLTCYEAVGKARVSASTNRYMAALKDKDNNVVQRAAIGLRYIGDRRAIQPLIEALITQHTFELQAQGATGPGSINSTFDKSGGGVGGLSGGGGGLGVNQKPQRVRKSFFNEEVHRTLTHLTGQDFQFDKKLWKNWLGTQKEVPQFDGRRN
jgi:HEAT repeat protein